MITPRLDLDGCAAEPIRVPGAIQPHGWLLVHDVVSGRLVAYSENCEQLTGVAPGPAQVATLQAVVEDLAARVRTGSSDGAPVSVGSTVIGNRPLDATRALAGSLALLELEPASPQRGTQGSMYLLARRFVPLLQKASSVLELADLAAAEMKGLTGFGRCLVYAFDSDGNGNVLAERLDAGYDSYLAIPFRPPISRRRRATSTS